jgi:hypothetical protein
LKETFPGEAIDIRADRDSLVLVGSASNPGVAERAMALVASAYSVPASKPPHRITQSEIFLIWLLFSHFNLSRQE